MRLALGDVRDEQGDGVDEREGDDDDDRGESRPPGSRRLEDPK